MPGRDVPGRPHPPQLPAVTTGARCRAPQAPGGTRTLAAVAPAVKRPDLLSTRLRDQRPPRPGTDARPPAPWMPPKAAPQRSATRPTSWYRPPYHSSGSPSPSPIATTSPIAIVWSPPAINSRSVHATHDRAPSMIGTSFLEAVRHRLELLGLGHLRGEHLGHVLLVGAQHVDPEAAGLADDRERAGVVLEAHERQQRVQRQRAQRVGGHAAGRRRSRARDHRDAGREPPEHLAEQLRIGLDRHRRPL